MENDFTSGKVSKQFFYDCHDSVSISNIVFNKAHYNKMRPDWLDAPAMVTQTSRDQLRKMFVATFQWMFSHDSDSVDFLWILQMFVAPLRLRGEPVVSQETTDQPCPTAGVPAGRNQQCSTHLNHRLPARQYFARAKLQGSRLHHGSHSTCDRSCGENSRTCMPCKRVTIVFSCASLSLTIWKYNINK